MQQLDLLSWSPPPAVVLRLPVNAWAPAIWRPRVERTALGLSNKKSERAREAYWQQVCQGVATQLRRHGASEVEIMTQLKAFFAAVDQAMSQGRDFA